MASRRPFDSDASLPGERLLRSAPARIRTDVDETVEDGAARRPSDGRRAKV